MFFALEHDTDEVAGKGKEQQGQSQQEVSEPQLGSSGLVPESLRMANPEDT